MKTRSLLIIIAIGLSLATVLAYFGKHYWLFDLLSHFRLQYFILLLSCFFVLILWNYKWPSLLLILFIGINFQEVFRVYLPLESPECAETFVSINCINLLNSNNEYQEVIKYLEEKDADLLILTEFSSLWEGELDSYLQKYPHQLRIPREDHFGIAAFSRMDILEIKKIELNEVDIPSLMLRFMYEEIPVTVIATHPLPPTDPFQFRSRNNQFKRIGELKNNIEGQFILAGDLNISPYSEHFKQMMHDMSLKDTRKGTGVLATWPEYLPFMKIPIDHCLVSEGLCFKNRGVGPPVGSDHLPVYVEIGLIH